MWVQYMPRETGLQDSFQLHPPRFLDLRMSCAQRITFMPAFCSRSIPFTNNKALIFEH